MTIVVSFVSQKGGVGKTTLAFGLAALAAQNGWRTKIADLDAGQASSTLTHTLRLQTAEAAAAREATKAKPKPIAPKPQFEVQVFSRTVDALRLSDHFDLYIIDGPAKTSGATYEIARNSHLVIQPTSPAMVDLVPAVAEFKALEAAGIEAARLILALNKVKTPEHEAQARHFLSSTAPQYRVWGQALRDKAGYVDAMNTGSAITEAKAKSLRTEAVTAIESLMAIVMGSGEGEAAA